MTFEFWLLVFAGACFASGFVFARTTGSRRKEVTVAWLVGSQEKMPDSKKEQNKCS